MAPRQAEFDRATAKAEPQQLVAGNLGVLTIGQRCELPVEPRRNFNVYATFDRRFGRHQTSVALGALRVRAKRQGNATFTLQAARRRGYREPASACAMRSCTARAEATFAPFMRIEKA